MLFILLCTEGEVTEPEYLDALVNSIKGQSPQTGDSMVDIISIPLGGNQGHRRLVESADQKVKDYTENPENLIYLSDETDDRESGLSATTTN